MQFIPTPGDFLVQTPCIGFPPAERQSVGCTTPCSSVPWDQHITEKRARNAFSSTASSTLLHHFLSLGYLWVPHQYFLYHSTFEAELLTGGHNLQDVVIAPAQVLQYVP